MNTKAILIGGFVALAVVSFYAGAYYITTGNTLPFLATSSIKYDSVFGKVSAVSATSVTVTLPDGTIKSVPVDANTQVMTVPTPAPATLGSLRAGTSVMVAFPKGTNGVAEIIQILQQAPVPPPPQPKK